MHRGDQHWVGLAHIGFAPLANWSQGLSVESWGIQGDKMKEPMMRRILRNKDVKALGHPRGCSASGKFSESCKILEKFQGALGPEKSLPATTLTRSFPANPSMSLMAKWRFLLCCFSLSGSPCPSQCTYIIFSIHSKIPFCFWNIQFSQTSLLCFCWGHTVLQAYNLCSLAESDLSDTMMGKIAESKRNYENLSWNKILQLA